MLFTVFFERNNMTVNEIIKKAEAKQVLNIAVDSIIDYINEIDEMIFEDIISTHEMPEGERPAEYIRHTGINDSVTAPKRFCDMYVYYILSQVDIVNSDTKRYENDTALYQQCLNEYSAYYNRTHMPIERNKISW